MTGKRTPAGFSVIELLMVIAIIGILVAILMPALQAARESARRTECSNNLRQLGQAALNHESVRQSFPYGGWGYAWAPVPGRERAAQPGGWMWSLLPYLEQENLATLAKQTATQHEGAWETLPDESMPPQLAFLSRPLDTVHCPSRRATANYPIAEDRSVIVLPYGELKAGAIARGDYAINSGPSPLWFTRGPKNLEQGDSERALFPSSGFVGISHYRRGATDAQISDGTSQTYLFGEKYLYYMEYENGKSRGDDASLYSGYSLDTHRFTRRDLVPRPDHIPIVGDEGIKRFGGPHIEGCYFVFCDGHVSAVDYDIDDLVHCRNGHRSDNGATACE